MKAKERIYRGIGFISVAELPADQQLLLDYAQQPERIKILMEGKIQSNCIQYRHYSEWYQTVYKQSVVVPELKPVEQKVFHPVQVALSKV